MNNHPKQNGERSVESSTKRPTTAQMVNTAIINLNDGGGSSLKAITKYMEAHYPIEVKKSMPYIKAYLKKSLLDGTVIQKSGVGLSGSFKLSKKLKETEKKENQKTNRKIKEGDAGKRKVKSPGMRKRMVQNSSANDSKDAKSRTNKTKESTGIEVKDRAKGEINKVKKTKTNTKETKTKTKLGTFKEGKMKKVEPKKSRAKTITRTDPSKRKKIRVSLYNGNLIKRKSLGAKNKRPKGPKGVKEATEEQ